MKEIFWLVGLVACSFLSCDTTDGFGPEWMNHEVLGVQPLYSDANLSREITKELIREQENNTNSVQLGDLRITQELGAGVHVGGLDFTPLYFIDIPGNYTVQVENDLLVVDNYNDLVTLQVDQDSFQIISRNADAISFSNHPEVRNIYFECISANHPKIFGWDNVLLDRPNCFREF